MNLEDQIYLDIAKLQGRIMDLEKKVEALKQTESRLMALEQSLEEFGINLSSVQEFSDSF